MKKIKFNKLIN